MPLFPLCHGDQLVDTLQQVFKANIVRIPEARIQTLCAIALTSREPRFWGYLPELVEGNLDGASAIKESRMADIAGKQSRSINLDLGLQILEGFLSGFGLPSAAIATQFSGAKTVSFSFQEVVRRFVSPATLGNLLQGHALNVKNSANDIFFKQSAVLLVTDSIITSKDFSIQVGKTNTQDFKLNVPAIQDMVGKASASVKVESSTGLDITFKGEQALTFAFTCLRCEVDPAGRIALKPHATSVHFAAPSFEPELLHPTPVMIEWD